MLSTLTRSLSRPREAERPRARAAIDALPNELLVSIFASFLAEPEFVLSREERVRRRSSNLRFVRETFPRVCRDWRDLYYSRNASPLHETLEIDFSSEGPEAVPRRVVRAERVIAWAERRRRAGDVRVLRVVGGHFCDPRGFTSEDMGALVEILGPSLIEITREDDDEISSLAEGPFWDALRDFAVPAGKLRKLKVGGILADLVDGDVDDAVGDNDVDVSFLGQLTSLEELAVEAVFGLHGGFMCPPESLMSLTKLRHLRLDGHWYMKALPRGISSLRSLESLNLFGCHLASLPKELGTLKRLTKLELSANMFGPTELEFEDDDDEEESLLRAAAEDGNDDVFPAALRGLQSLRYLRLHACDLIAVPSFIGELQALEDLDLSGNDCLGNFGFAAPLPELPALTALELSNCRFTSVPAPVLSSMPRLRVLKLAHNDLRSLPNDLRQRLPLIREIDLKRTPFAAVPLSSLTGATAAVSP